MTIGDTVTSPDKPGAVGIISRRIDSNYGVTLLVSWTLADGATVLCWHDPANITRIPESTTRQT
jgi:hypothetical protein